MSVRDMEIRQYFIQVRGRRDGKPYGICQICNCCVISQNFERHLSMVNELYSNFVQLRKCLESSYLSTAEKTLDLKKNSAFGDFSKLNTHSKNAVLVISAVVQTSFRHGK
jgi:hypothetical protein